jgi:aminocarboxymuconate-semialdehyde decarboxylase
MRIDVHAHAWSENYLDRLAASGFATTAAHRGLGAGTTTDELRARFALMDSAGIQLQILSATPASPHFANETAAVAMSRQINDEYAELAARHPDRFRAFAALPLPHVQASLEELRRSLDELGMLGVAITTSILGHSIADPLFAPIYAELNRRGSVLYVHPAGCGAESPLIQQHRLTWAVGAPVEDTVAIMHLIYAGIPKRYPKMKIITAHLGGALPMLMERIDHQYLFEAPDIPEKPSIAAKRLWYDTVGHDHVPALRAAVETFGAGRLLLGTDFPYQGGELFQTTVDYVHRAGLSPADTQAILDTNAAQLLGLAR